MTKTTTQTKNITKLKSNKDMFKEDLMGNDIRVIEDDAIFEDTSNTIKNALEKVYNHSNSTKRISKSAFEIALKQLI